MSNQCATDSNDLCMHRIDVQTDDWMGGGGDARHSNEQKEVSINTLERIEEIEFHGFIDNS